MITIVSELYEYSLGEWASTPIAAFDSDDKDGITQFIKDKEMECIEDEYVKDQLMKFRTKWYKNNPDCCNKMGIVASDRAADEFLKSFVGAKDKNYYYQDFAGDYVTTEIPAYGALGEKND